MPTRATSIPAEGNLPPRFTLRGGYLHRRPLEHLISRPAPPPRHPDMCPCLHRLQLPCTSFRPDGSVLVVGLTVRPTTSGRAVPVVELSVRPTFLGGPVPVVELTARPTTSGGSIPLRLSKVTFVQETHLMKDTFIGDPIPHTSPIAASPEIDSRARLNRTGRPIPRVHPKAFSVLPLIFGRIAVSPRGSGCSLPHRLGPARLANL